jgi:hypothetical protein
MKKKLLITLAVILIGIQFIRIDKQNPPVTISNDFIEVNHTPENIAILLKTACYDCHSYETNYPWYTNISPVSWFVKHHIDEGREHLNFSEWGTYNSKKKSHKLDECIEEVEEGEMPLTSYTIMHSNASLDQRQKDMLINYFKSI